MSENSGTLRAQMQRSALLTAVAYGSSIGLRLISTVVLTRLLAPEVYGVFAVVLLYMYLLEMTSDLGLRSLILTKEGEVSTGFLQTCWTVSILRGLAITVVSGLIALVIAAFQSGDIFDAAGPYAAPALPWAIAALGLGALLYGFESPMRFMSEREMAFGRVTLVDLIRNTVTLVVTIVLAFYLRSIWALVLGNIVRSCVHVALSFAVFQGPRMSLLLDREYLRILIVRGKWILSQSSLAALSQSSDRILFGFVMNSSTFGLYYIARQLIDLLLLFLNAVNGQMGLQVFSRLHRQGLADFRRNYYRYRLVLDALAGLSVGGIVVLAPMVIEIIFDDRYRGVAPIMQILALAGLTFGPLVMRSVFNAEREFRLTTLGGLISAVTLWVGLGIAIFVFDSLEGALFVAALYTFPEAAFLTLMGRIRAWVSFRREIAVAIFFALGVLAGWVVLWAWNLLT